VVSLYVDDLIYISNDDELMMELNKSIKSKFTITNIEKMKFFHDIEET